MKAILPLTVLVLIGCALTPTKRTDRYGNTTEVEAVSMGDREAAQAMQEEQLRTSSSVVAYEIPHGIQKDDSFLLLTTSCYKYQSWLNAHPNQLNIL